MKSTISISVLLLAIAGPRAQPTAAPSEFKVRLDTTKGAIVIDVHRDWAPNGVNRFYELVTGGYYDNAAFFRIRKGTWVQFGIAADPNVAQAWRTKTIPDDPWKGVSNTRGTIAYAFKEANGRTTQYSSISRTTPRRTTCRQQGRTKTPSSCLAT